MRANILLHARPFAARDDFVGRSLTAHHGLRTTLSKSIFVVSPFEAQVLRPGLHETDLPEHLGVRNRAALRRDGDYTLKWKAEGVHFPHGRVNPVFLTQGITVE